MPFKPATPAVDKRLIVNVEGQTKTGRTSLALDFPNPRYFLDLDLNLKELLRKDPSLAEGLYHSEYLLSPDPTPDEAADFLIAFMDDYQDAMESAKNGGTVIVDTATRMWQVIQKVKLDKKLDQRVKQQAAKLTGNDKGDVTKVDRDLITLFPYDYREANELAQALFNRPHLYSKLNAVFVNKHADVWSSSGPTGEWRYQGFNDLPYIVQASIVMKRDVRSKELLAEFGPNRFSNDLVGMEWPGRLTYDDLVSTFLGDA